jgi:hypothetical protein
MQLNRNNAMLTRIKNPLMKLTTSYRSYSIFSSGSNSLSVIGKMIYPKRLNGELTKIQNNPTWPRELAVYKELSASHKNLENTIG